MIDMSLAGQLRAYRAAKPLLERSSQGSNNLLRAGTDSAIMRALNGPLSGEWATSGQIARESGRAQSTVNLALRTTLAHRVEQAAERGRGGVRYWRLRAAE